MSIQALCELQKKAFHVNSGAIIFKSKHVGRHFRSDFQRVLEGSQRFCPDFMGFCPDIHQIETFGGAVTPPAPPPPTPVSQNRVHRRYILERKISLRPKSF